MRMFRVSLQAQCKRNAEMPLAVVDDGIVMPLCRMPAPWMYVGERSDRTPLVW